MKVYFLAVALLTTLAVPAGASFFSFQEWAAMRPQQRAMYIAGAYDTVTGLASNDADVRRVRHQVTCMANSRMNNNQLAANVLEFAKTKPKLQTGPVVGALLEYLFAACGPVKPSP